MDAFWSNDYVYIAAYCSVAVLCTLVFLAVFEMVTSYKNWDEIKRGNLAVAMATGGKIIGIANIFKSSIVQHEGLLDMMIWGVFGFALLMAGYFIFEFLTPGFNVDDEIKNDNRAVGLISLIISIAISFIVGAGIS
ncbi:MAG: DUF350 domain-containing protein [Bacillus sp. (in: firmicutes)]